LAGGISVQVSSARVAHMGSASSSRLSDFAVYHGTRNRMWTFIRCMPTALFWLMLLPHIGATLLLWVHTTYRGAGKAYRRGLVDGLAGFPKVWASRRIIQATRKVGIWGLLAQFAWSPMTLIKRAIVLRSIKKG
jgi:N-acetylglucosaminyl-diphospho-decaprenol L-rhamnosyltransferase